MLRLNERHYTFETPDPSADQEMIQRELTKVFKAEGLPAAMEALYRWELEAGYLTAGKLESNECLRFYDSFYELDFYIQVNRARSGYTPAPPAAAELPPLHCAICRENAGRPGKENLRVFEFVLGPEDGAGFFLQCTPYPVFPYHFVVITMEPEPMRVDRRSISEMVRFEALAPGFTVCSNSDVRGAGSSILEHHHLQVFLGLTLPVMTAGVCRRYGTEQTKGLKVSSLNYPAAAVRVEADCSTGSADREKLTDITASIVENWKRLDPGKNTANLIYSAACGRPCFHVLLRNPAYQIPDRLHRYKQEGIGIIEAAGVGIFPVPEGEEAPAVWNEIRMEGKEIMLRMIEGINPLPAGRDDIIGELVP